MADAKAGAAETWLLDTSAFYWCASEESQERLRQGGAILTTSPSSVLEILAGMKPEMNSEEFEQRQRALRAVESLCGQDGILTPNPDCVVAEAFGCSQPDLPAGVLQEACRAAIQAASAEELQRAVPDLAQQVIRTVNITRLGAWDQEVGAYFARELGDAHVRPDPVAKQLAKDAGAKRHEAAMLARQLAAVAIARSSETRDFALIGLAGRAGLLQEEALTELAELEPAAAGARVRELATTAQEAYDGRLGGFVEVYVHYHSYLAWTGRSAGQNDCLDLDPFVYFDLENAAQKYVSGEKMWLKVVRLVDANRAVDARTFSQNPALK